MTNVILAWVLGIIIMVSGIFIGEYIIEYHKSVFIGVYVAAMSGWFAHIVCSALLDR